MVFQISTDFIIQPFLITLFPYFEFMVNWSAFINVGEAYLCLDMWPRDKRGLKMKPFYCFLEWATGPIGKRRTMGLIYKKKKKMDTCISSLPGQLRYCDTLLQFIIPMFQEAWSQLTRMFISVISLHRAALNTIFSVPVPTPVCPLWSAVPRSSAFSQEARN